MANIGWAMDQAKAGNKVRRAGWKEGMFVKVQGTDDKMTVPFAWVMTGKDDKVPWLPTQVDLLAGDWEAG